MKHRLIRAYRRVTGKLEPLAELRTKDGYPGIEAPWRECKQAVNPAFLAC